jgi:type I restriction enzyme S subunit
MQKLLSGEVRFPGFEDKWKNETLGKLCSFFSGGTPTSTNKLFYSGDIPFIGSGNINDDSVDQFITEDALNSSSAKIVEVGDLLYAMYGATSGEVGISKINGAINQAVLCIRSSQNSNFLYYLLSSKKNYIVSTFLQGGQGNLSAGIIKKIKVLMPSIKEQQKIVDVLLSCDNEIQSLKDELESIKLQKKGLMQQLLTGKIRVKV